MRYAVRRWRSFLRRGQSSLQSVPEDYPDMLVEILSYLTAGEDEVTVDLWLKGEAPVNEVLGKVRSSKR